VKQKNPAGFLQDSFSKKSFRQTAHERKLKHPFTRSIIFLFGYASRSENDKGSNLTVAPRTAHVAAAE